MSSWPRLFTVEEATDLLPELRPLLRSIQTHKRRIDILRYDIRGITPAMATNGHGHKVAEIERELSLLIEQINQQIGEITQRGVEVKDMDIGLVDFPSRRDGRIVYLCWRVDEPAINFWHELDTGIAGRQLL